MVLGKLKKKVTKAKARLKGMSVKEYKAHRKRLRKKKLEEKTKFELWKVEQKYKQKRKSVKKGGGTGFLKALGGYAEDVTKEFERQYGLSQPSKKRRKKKR